MPRVASEASALLLDLHVRLQSVVEAARKEGHDSALNEIRSLVGVGAPMKRGRPFGSKNKPKVAAAASIAKPAKKRRNSWAGLSAADRLARVNAIRKGKRLPPRSE